MTRNQYLKNVTTLAMDSARCNGCKSCLQVCPRGVFSYIQKKAVIAERDRCMECGACQKNCETGAVTVQAGVGCAAAIINGMLSKNGQAACDC